MTPILAGVPKEEVSKAWPVVWPLLRPAVEIIGRHTAKSIWDALQVGDFQLWAVVGEKTKAAVITEIADWPAARDCTILYCGGKDVDDWVGERSVIEAWAKERGCERVFAGGRVGWAKKLPDYEVVAVTLVKDLRDA